MTITQAQLDEWKGSGVRAALDGNSLTYAEEQCVAAVPALVAEVERLRAALRECCADFVSRPCSMFEAPGLLLEELERRADIARAALPEEK